jgi:single-strand selective monofunctional uracil DNA glycosylase
MDMVRAARALNRRLAPLRFGGDITHVYNPLTYALGNYAEYAGRFGTGPKHVLLLGMNPGPFGMAQTGIPFGDVRTVGNWLNLHHPVGKPEVEHPKRPVLGLKCPRVEVSGKRLWGAIRDRFGTPQRFFERFFVANYCPLCFMEESGKNRTPDKLPAAEREPLYAACDWHLRTITEHLDPHVVVGIGRFAESRARVALEGHGVRIGTVLHPSPANPAANRGWAEVFFRQLEAL